MAVKKGVSAKVPRRKAASGGRDLNGSVPAAEVAAPAEAIVAAGDPTAPRIFQIYFEPWHRDLIDPAFVPLNNAGLPTEYLEFDLFERLSVSEHVTEATLWGALSWRFSEKTGLTGADLLATIAANPGHDVYFCNPYPENEALYHNMWLQGEPSHPRFAELCRAFLTAAGLPAGDVDAIMPSQLFSAANYFVGTPRFWHAYLRFVRGAIVRAEANLAPEIRTALHSSAADDRNVHAGASYMPFIVERLFPLFLRSAGKEMTSFKVPLSVPETEMNVHLRLLREMKDAAWKAKSAWLAACWVNYRNLYLQQQHGQDWTRKFLRAVTPTDIRFG